MELPQPRPFEAEDNYVKTHDFLQPLEQMWRENSSKEEAIDDISVIQSPQPPAPPPVENLLPGRIGTYTISHISNVNQRALKPEGSIFTAAQSSGTDHNYEKSICSSHTENGFTLWEQYAAKKGKTGKESIAQKAGVGGADSGRKTPKWTPLERSSQSYSNDILTRHTSLCTSQAIGQKNQSFIDTLKLAKVFIQEEEEDDVEEFVIKTEPQSNQKGELNVKMDSKNAEQNRNTPRSKHSATEQRRRSKINDRFQMLRQLIPHSDKKRDKASFLLEVIEFIHFLQEKVHKYEGSFRGWNSDPEEMLPLRNNPMPGESPDEQSGGEKNCSSSELFATNIDEKNITSLRIPENAHNTMRSGISIATTYVGSYQNPRTIKNDSNSVSNNLKAKGLIIEDGSINISSAYSQGLLHNLTRALQDSGVDLSQANLSVQIEVGKQANMNIRPSVQQFSQKDNDILASNQGMARSRMAASEETVQPFKKLKKDRS